MFHVTNSKLEPIHEGPDLREMVLGKWTWSTPGADNAVIDL